MFRKMVESIYKIGCAIGNYIWWPIWSNVRWSKYATKDTFVREEDKVKTLTDIKNLVVRLYEKFEWTKDGVDELFDSICPPPYNYKRYCDGLLKDDCDGFHSLVYHCLKNSGIECYLLSTCAIGSGHCVLIFKYRNKWYVNDYRTVYAGYETAQEAVAAYNIEYVKKYSGAKSDVLFNSTVSYNYNTAKFSAGKVANLK